ncbi:MAG TPA: aryl-sulfate sulfotransferase [Longilinea sp.]|nr:aryl-sulfate sulfotransferase [Longilinea sp.]
MKKKILYSIAAVIVILGIAAGVVFSGLLVMPTKAALAKDTPVENYDILEVQCQREQDILTDYAKGSYTIQNPYVIQDPYQANPLSALILFETAEPAQATVTVMGKNQYATFTYTYSDFTTHHEVAVLGLYADQKNQVELTITYQNGQKETSEQILQTEPLPYDFPNLDVQISKPKEMEQGVDLMISCLDTNYSYMLDANGDVRGYFTDKNFGHCTAMRVLKNGHLLATGEVMKLMPYNMYDLWEMNLLGKIFTEYEIPNAVHHDIIELDNGDFLAASSDANMPLDYDTREDVVIRIDRQTGEVKDEYNLRQILDDTREPFTNDSPDVQVTNRDWAHLNSVEIDEADNSIIVSLAIQSAVVKFDPDTMQIDWILSSPEGWDGNDSKYQQYLLKPIGDNFDWQWGQHAAKILPDTDGDPNTIDLLLFDNGQVRSFTKEGGVDPANNYSRAVIYRIDEVNRTVQQVWEYGKELGSSAYASFLGNAELLPRTGNINIDFGGMIRTNGVPVDNVVASVLGAQQVQSRVMEVQRDGQEVFDVSITPNNSTESATYQVRKIDLYNSSMNYLLGQFKGERKGTVQTSAPITYSLPPIFIPRISVDFMQIYQQDTNLIVQGTFQYQNKTYTLGKVLFVLKNKDHQYIFQSYPGLDGIFDGRFDLSQVAPGEYAIYVAGGVIEGKDYSGKIMAGYNPTGYKIDVK